ncbi:MAG: outer membrane beta-barrel protein [Planctomycetes bacterium]|nr:outer membrane beta-barrel protein [Planctomycetota bacterium]
MIDPRSRSGAPRLLFFFVSMAVACTGQAFAQVTTTHSTAPRPEEDPEHVFGLKSGNWTFQPTVSTSEVYNSNIFLSDGDEQDDFITNVIPGFGIRFDSDKVQAALASTVRFAFFADHTESDAVEPLLTGSFKVVPGDVYVTWGGYFQRTEDPLDEVFAARLPVEQYSYYAGFGYAKAPWNAEVLFEHIDFAVDEADFEFVNYEVNEVRAKVGYVLNPQWKLLTTGVGGHTDYVEEVKEDNVFEEGAIGAQWLPSDSFGILAEIGYRNQDYDSGSGEVAFTEDYRGPVTRLTARWYASPEDKVVLAYSHRPEESVFGNYSANDTLRLFYDRRLHDRWSVRASVLFQRAEEGDADNTQALRDSMVAEAGVTYRIAGGLVADLSYSHSLKRTNDGTGEYDVDQVSLGVTVSF